jgi:phage tail-like protein
MNVEGIPNCRFYLEIGSDAQAVFTDVSGLQLEMSTFDYEEGGQNDFVHRLPGRVKTSNLTLKRGMTRSNDLLKWFLEVASGNVVRQNVSLVVFDVEGNRLATWNFENAYPVKWVGPQLEAAGTTIAVETLELAHDAVKLA